VVTVDETEKQYRFEDRTYSQIVVRVFLRRLYWRYLLRYMTVLCVLVGISWATFAIDPRKVCKRGLVVSGTFVALVGMQFVAQEGTPKVSYFTRLEKFIYVAFLFISSLMIQTIVAWQISFTHRDHGLALVVDKWCAISYVCAFFLYLVVWLFHPTKECVFVSMFEAF
jgi:hypothetical protein